MGFYGVLKGVVQWIVRHLRNSHENLATGLRPDSGCSELCLVMAELTRAGRFSAAVTSTCHTGAPATPGANHVASTSRENRNGVPPIRKDIMRVMRHRLTL